MKDNSDSQFFYKILNGINSNNRIIDVEAKRDETKVLKPKISLAYQKRCIVMSFKDTF